MYNNTFNMADLFVVNYNLPDKPKPYKFGKKNFIVLILFCWIWIPMYIIQKSAANKKIKEWEDAFNYRTSNWGKEYDKAAEKIMSKIDIKGDGMKKLNLQEEDIQAVKPFIVWGPDWNAKEFYYRKKVSGDVISNKREYTCVFFTDDQILFYIRSVDLVNPSVKKERTMEYFYSDITSVSISEESVSYKAGCNLEKVDKDDDVETQRLKIVVPGDSQRLSYTPDDNALKSVNAMRSLLRDRKKK